MKRLPKNKVSLSVYVSAEARTKLHSLQQIYFIANNRWSLSNIVEFAIDLLYYITYFSQFKTFKRKLKEAIGYKKLWELINPIGEKKEAAKEIMSIKL